MKKIFSLFVLFMVCLPLQAETFTAGKDYQVLPLTAQQAVPPSDKVQVMEFFSYACPWCYRLEPAIDAWAAKKPANVELVRIPVVFSKRWVIYAKTYYLVHASGKEQSVSPKIFAALHKQNLKLTNEKEMTAFLIKQGLSKAQIANAFESPSTDLKMANAKQLVSALQIMGVPTIVVAGKYKIDTKMTQGDNEKMMRIVDFLLAKAGTQTEKAS